MPAALVAIVEGLQLPLIPLVDCEGNDGAVLFKHNGPTGLKVGVMPDVIVMSRVVVVAVHPVALGVNV